MDAQLSEPDSATAPRARVGRAVALIVASLVTITAAAVGFLHPELGAFGPSATPGAHPALRAPYHVAAADFVSPDVGWVLMDTDSADFALLHTVDGGLTWTNQMSASTGGNQQYMKFFDAMVGVFALVGTRPVLYRTADGGRTWTSVAALGKHSTVLSWSFVDSDHGWMVADPNTGSPRRIYRTENRGWTWTDLGPPVTPPDEVFGAHFSFLTTGWLASAGAGPYAYKTGDFGETWTRVRLPVPHGAATGPGRFFVDVQQTSGGGAIASVVYFPEFLGRGGIGGRIRQFPPLEVPFYDGSRPNNYIYSTMIDQVIGGPFAAVQAPQAELLSTVDNGATWTAIEPPALSGTLGYADARSWWWVDTGAWASSGDGGVTWNRPLGAGLIEPLPGSLQVLDREHAWFAGLSAPALEATNDGGRHWRQLSLPPLAGVPLG